jgi:hypothetical protein
MCSQWTKPVAVILVDQTDQIEASNLMRSRGLTDRGVIIQLKSDLPDCNFQAI